MTDRPRTDSRAGADHQGGALLALVAALFVAISIIGLTWGLPSRAIDKYLFGDASPWPGEKIYRLAHAGNKFDPARLATTGADVDIDPVRRASDAPVLLTETEEDVARIYLRYRLYTHQPDEMIVMMALAGMHPAALDFDPRLYQYGGLFIYPVGALIGLGRGLGLIDLRSDVTYYLDHPEEFSKFYIVARAYSAAWGLVGVLVVYAIARRLHGSAAAGLLAALLFTLMPVVVCMAHEGKPHLPGAALMLLAIHQGLCFLQAPTARRSFVGMCLACGAACGMVINAGPILILIPLVAYLHVNGLARQQTPAPPAVLRWKHVLRIAVLGVAAAVVVYLLTNPYVLFNALANREVLRSNFGNSLAMYEIARVGAGLGRAVELTIEGATLPIVVLGVLGLVAGLIRGNRVTLPLAVPALVFFTQFVLIGAGKPAEYGRFGVFPDTALAIGTACLLTAPWTRIHAFARWVPPLLVVAWTGLFGAAYLRNFQVDGGPGRSRWQLAQRLAAGAAETRARGLRPTVVVAAEPAPYGCPPLDFAKMDIVLAPRTVGQSSPGGESVFIAPVDGDTSLSAGLRLFWNEPGVFAGLSRLTPISWANKSFITQYTFASGTRQDSAAD